MVQWDKSNWNNVCNHCIPCTVFMLQVSTKVTMLNKSTNLFEQEIDFMHHYAFPALKSYSVTYIPCMSSYLQRNLFHFSNETLVHSDIYVVIVPNDYTDKNVRSVVDVSYQLCFNEIRHDIMRSPAHLPLQLYVRSLLQQYNR